MPWADHHRTSEKAAERAELTRRTGDPQRALELYREAAAAERRALDELPEGKPRTLGITAVSAVALAYKGRDFAGAEKLAHQLLVSAPLPDFAAAQLRELLQLIWAGRSAEGSGIQFLPGDVLVSVRGGEVLPGGAPLDLIITKIDQIQAIFYRTIEMLLGQPLRRRGLPKEEVRSQLHPWLFQAPAGSYQFTVRVQSPKQQKLFPEKIPEIRRVSDTVLSILEAAGADPRTLDETIPDEAYRTAFLKMTREIAPRDGGRFSSLVVRDAASTTGPQVVLTPQSRQTIAARLKTERPRRPEPGEPEAVTGVLRAVELDKDWLIVAPDDGQRVKVTGLTDVLDDLVGPMVNKRVNISARRSVTGLSFEDIELLE